MTDAHQAADQQGAEPFAFPAMEPDTRPLSHTETFVAILHHAREIVRLSEVVTAKCTPDDVTQPTTGDSK